MALLFSGVGGFEEEAEALDAEILVPPDAVLLLRGFGFGGELAAVGGGAFVDGAAPWVLEGDRD